MKKINIYIEEDILKHLRKDISRGINPLSSLINDILRKQMEKELRIW